ncbi:DUF4230 domain-containing protein [Haloferula sp. BvORR071]|uniref:DUF4230 domain-containing protein n=1 Tax=Haloferula sp. BvORR071 TaxID=1396141 RepID=UPI0005585B3F|nr:DUF4230 domain-containing protein [Haloferula sp. BvORR071]
MSEHERPELWKTLRWLGVLATLVALGWLGVGLVNRSIGGTVTGLEKVLGAITGSTTRIVEGRAEINSTSEISELALIELEMTATRSFENEAYIFKYLPAGTKRLIAKGRFRITAGYKLEPGVSLKMENGVPIARFPEPQILSVELKDFQQLDERDGWANQITGADRDQLIKDLTLQMRQEAARSGVLEIAESTLRTRLKDLLGAGEVKVERAEKKKPEGINP